MTTERRFRPIEEADFYSVAANHASSTDTLCLGRTAFPSDGRHCALTGVPCSNHDVSAEILLGGELELVDSVPQHTPPFGGDIPFPLRIPLCIPTVLHSIDASVEIATAAVFRGD